MPWVSEELCDGCGICVDQCYVGAISIIDNIAVIDEEKCIRCAVCHDVCPNDAVRHDGERIPEEVASNMAWVNTLLTHEYYANDKEKQKGLVKRLQRYFAKNRKVMEKTIEQLELMEKTQYSA